MADRAPTKTEIARWDRFLALLDRCGRLILANSARSLQADQLRRFGLKWDLEIEPLKVADEQALLRTAQEWKKIRRGVSLVESYELGLQFFDDGEISIVAPSSYTKEQIKALNLDGWFIPLAIGVVALAGIVGRMLLVESENDRLASAYDTMIAASEKRICSDPLSAACKSWQVEATSTDYAQRKSLIDEISDSLSSVGSAMKKGLGIGALLAIPLIAWLVLKK